MVLLILGRTVPRNHLLYSKGNEKLALVDRHEKTQAAADPLRAHGEAVLWGGYRGAGELVFFMEQIRESRPQFDSREQVGT